MEDFIRIKVRFNHASSSLLNASNEVLRKQHHIQEDVGCMGKEGKYMVLLNKAKNTTGKSIHLEVTTRLTPVHSLTYVLPCHTLST